MRAGTDAGGGRVRDRRHRWQLRKLWTATPAAAAARAAAVTTAVVQCAEDCADTDPCTQDRCDTAASPPRCVHEPTKALVKDGVSETLLADEMHRVTMASGLNAFYYSVFEQTNMSPEVTLYRLGRDSAASEELAKVSSVLFIGQARSAGGLVVDTSLGEDSACTRSPR